MKFTPLIAAAAVMILPVTASAYIVSSASPEIAVGAPETMTDNPRGILEETPCFPASQDMSEPALLLAAGDWIVTGEAEFQGFELVSYAEGAVHLGEGRCHYEDGRIAVWREGAFLGVFEQTNPDLDTIGYIYATDTGEVAVRSGKPDPAASGLIRYDAATEELYYDRPAAK